MKRCRVVLSLPELRERVYRDERDAADAARRMARAVEEAIGEHEGAVGWLITAAPETPADRPRLRAVGDD